jgi:Rps23 Pro-64 3,4-dihydroxylase Tpa1-like proline 4-hydroxylase
LNLIEADDKVTVITAEHNRLVLFDVRTGGEHRVSSVSSDAGSKTRTSIGGWFLSGGPPEE